MNVVSYRLAPGIFWGSLERDKAVGFGGCLPSWCSKYSLTDRKVFSRIGNGNFKGYSTRALPSCFRTVLKAFDNCAAFSEISTRDLFSSNTTVRSGCSSWSRLSTSSVCASISGWLTVVFGWWILHCARPQSRDVRCDQQKCGDSLNSVFLQGLWST